MFDDSNDNPTAVPHSLSKESKPLKLKLISRRTDTEQFYLASEDGRMLPGQMSVCIDSSLDTPTVITVKFIVDNNNLWIED